MGGHGTRRFAGAVNSIAVAAAVAGMAAAGTALAAPASANPAVNGRYVFDWYTGSPFKENVTITSCGSDCLTMDFGPDNVVEYRFVNNAWKFTRYKDDAVTCDNGQVVGAEQTTFINPEFTAGQNVASADCGRGVLPMRPAAFNIIRLP